MANLERVRLEIEAQKKSGWIAALLNFFFPGVGYMYCGRGILGTFVLLYAIALVVASFGGIVFGPIYYLSDAAYWGLVIIAVIDGFLCAGRYNKKLITQGLARYDNDISTEQNKTSGVGSLEDLSKLVELKEKGLLTEEEFQSQKNKILNGTKPVLPDKNSNPLPIIKPWYKKASVIFIVIIAVAIGASALLYSPLSNLRGRVATQKNMESLYEAFVIYSDDNDYEYPAANRWCDIVVNYSADNRSLLRSANATEGPCNFAMNPNVSPSSSADAVVLFETRSGWDQYGGPEILTTENNNGEGCNILFNDGHVEFVRTKDLVELDWGVE